MVCVDRESETCIDKYTTRVTPSLPPTQSLPPSRFPHHLASHPLSMPYCYLTQATYALSKHRHNAVTHPTATCVCVCVVQFIPNPQNEEREKAESLFLNSDSTCGYAFGSTGDVVR